VGEKRFAPGATASNAAELYSDVPNRENPRRPTV
jgi:hypothetical protein